MKAMNSAFKYSNRYGYPDGGIMQEIAKHHGVKQENILLDRRLRRGARRRRHDVPAGGKKVLGVEPTFSSVYDHATSIKASAIKLPLGKDYPPGHPGATSRPRTITPREIGLVYLCNPNNPTGIIVTKDEVKQLLDGLPPGMPVLIDEAYHHFVEDPKYATSVPYVLEGRPVIIARTFSKIAALAGMRLGYAVARQDIIDKMRPYSMGSINALVKWGGAASIKDAAGQARMKKTILDTRKKTTADLQAPTATRCCRRRPTSSWSTSAATVQPVIEEFKKKNIMVGRPFPPMTEHLRVSVGTPDDMDKFLKAFKEIFPAKAKSTAAGV